MNERAVKKHLRAAARLFGLDPYWLFTIARIESNFNPAAKNGSSGAAGLFQFLKGTAKEENIDPMNVAEASAATAKRIRRDISALGEMGLPVLLVDVYLCHQQGRVGYAEIVRCQHAGKESGRLSDSRVRNMRANLDKASLKLFDAETSHWGKANVFLGAWNDRINAAYAKERGAR